MSQVLNGFPFDIRGRPPTIGRISLAADHRPGTAGTRVIYAAVSTPYFPYSVAGTPGGPSVLSTVVRSGDNGDNWASVLSPQTLDRNPNNANREVIAGTVARPGVFGGQAMYDLALAIAPNDPQTVLLGGVRTWRSSDGGANWNRIDAQDIVRPHEDHHAWAFTVGAVYDGNDGGIWKYTAGAAVPWVDLNGTTLGTLQVNSVATNNAAGVANPVYLYGTQDNGTARLDPAVGQQWTMVGGGDGGVVRFAPSDANVAYVVQNTTGRSGTQIVQQSLSAGETWRRIQQYTAPAFDATPAQQRLARELGLTGDRSFASTPPFAVSPTNPTHVVTGSSLTYEGQASANPDTGRAPIWERNPQISTNDRKPDNRPITVSALAFANDLTYYAGFENGQLWMNTRAPGVFPRQLSRAGLLGPWGTNAITSILVDPATINNPPNRQTVYLTVGGTNAQQKVYRSVAGGDAGSWVNLSADLPNNLRVNTLALDTRAALPVLYIGTDVGVYRGQVVNLPNPNAAQGGMVPQVRTWESFNDGLPLVKVTDLQNERGQFLLAATYGRGVYRIALPAVPADRGAIEGIRQTGIKLASFLDPNATGSYSVLVTWGDGTISTASPGNPSADISLQQSDTDPTRWAVVGAHTYAHPGAYIATVVVYDFSGSTPDPLASDSACIYVDDASLSVEFPDMMATTGTAISSNQPIASFTDGNPVATAADFYAAIDWGDGTHSDSEDSIPEIWITADTLAPGHFYVWGNHTYLNATTFGATLFIGETGRRSATASATDTVSGPIAAVPVELDGVEGSTLTNVAVATFSTTIDGGTAEDFSATVDWGDGQTTSATVQSDANGGFNVFGTHTYAETGSYSLHVTIQKTDGSFAALDTIAAIDDAQLSGSPITLSNPQNPQVSQLALTSFTDANPAGTVGEYTATIDWGDNNGDGGEEDGGNSDAIGTITVGPDNNFIVSGSHTYGDLGTYQVTIDVTDTDGSQTVVTNTIAVEFVAQTKQT